VYVFLEVYVHLAATGVGYILIPELCSVTGRMCPDPRINKHVLHPRLMVTLNQQQKAVDNFIQKIRPAAFRHLAVWGLRLADSDVRTQERGGEQMAPHTPTTMPRTPLAQQNFVMEVISVPEYMVSRIIGKGRQV
jgi:hypothetical protein